MSRIGDIIREMRIKRGLSQAQLGDMVGVGRSAISNYEKGFRIPDLETAEKLADAFNVSFGNFVDGQEIIDRELQKPLPSNIRPINSPDESELVLKWRGLDVYGQKAVRAVLDAEVERCFHESE